MITRNELLYLLHNWGVWARGLSCPCCSSQLAQLMPRIDSEYDTELALKVESGLIRISKKCSVRPLIEFYCYQFTVERMAQQRKIPVSDMLRKLEQLEDELSMIL